MYNESLHCMCFNLIYNDISIVERILNLHVPSNGLIIHTLEGIVTTKEISENLLGISVECVSLRPSPCFTTSLGYSIFESLFTKLIICGSFPSCRISSFKVICHRIFTLSIQGKVDKKYQRYWKYMGSNVTIFGHLFIVLAIF